MHYSRVVFVALVLFFAATAFAQDEAEPLELGAAGLVALAMALNTGGVYFLVNVIKRWIPELRSSRPHWIPILAMLSGPFLNWAAAAMGGVFDWPINFSPLIGVLGGTAAVTAHQVRTQRGKESY